MPAIRFPAIALGGEILVRRSEFDAWASRYRQVGQPDVDRVVSEVLSDLCGGREHRAQLELDTFLR